MSSNKGVDDVEAGSNLLYPLMQEYPQLRWGFIRKVYSIVTLQLLATIAVASVVSFVRPVAEFFATRAGLITYIVTMAVVPLIILILLSVYRNKHPLNFVLLGFFTLCFGFALGVLSAFISGRVVMETVIATTVMVVSLTLYTFWAAKRGDDFGFLVPLLLSFLVVLITFTIFQFCFPMGRFSEIVCSGLSVIVFCAYLIFDTDNLIKRHSYDEYIWASVYLYLHIINIFINMLKIFVLTRR